MPNQIIEVDGAFGSGGGQVLRTACALSTITKKPCRVFAIRKGRSKSGLMPQHLLGIQALAGLCHGKLEGDYIGSEEIKFYPGEIKPKELFVGGGTPHMLSGVPLAIKIETAGSIALVLQSLVLAGLFSPSEIKINFEGGATDTFFSPTIDHFQHVFLKNLEKMNGKAEINILKRGYYPEGGAELGAIIYPSRLKNLNLVERGNLKNILVISGASGTLKDKKVAER